MNHAAKLAASSLILALTLAACGGGGGSDDAPAPTTPGSSSSAPSSSSSSAATSTSSSSSSSTSSSSSSEQPSGVTCELAAGAHTAATSSCWIETFAASDRTTFTDSSYAQSTLGGPLYLEKSGVSGFTFSGDVLTMTNGRFLVGAISADDTAKDKLQAGMFDMKDKTCTLTLTAIEDQTAGNFQIYVNNSTTSASNSPLTTTEATTISRVHQASASAGTGLKAGDNTITWTLANTGNDATLSSAFLQLRADSAATIKITAAKMMCK